MDGSSAEWSRPFVLAWMKGAGMCTRNVNGHSPHAKTKKPSRDARAEILIEAAA
jgi:hypothetical protein